MGYHGRAEGTPVFGFVSYDDTERVEAPISPSSMHFHSNTRRQIVGDGQPPTKPELLIWRFDGNEYGTPRRLLSHGCSAHVQGLHVHPRFSPDGQRVVYTSDELGYGNVYLADVPDTLGALPVGDSD